MITCSQDSWWGSIFMQGPSPDRSRVQAMDIALQGKRNAMCLQQLQSRHHKSHKIVLHSGIAAYKLHVIVSIVMTAEGGSDRPSPKPLSLQIWCRARMGRMGSFAQLHAAPSIDVSDSVHIFGSWRHCMTSGMAFSLLKCLGQSSFNMQRCLLHRTIPNLTASLRSRVLPSSCMRPLNAQNQHGRSANIFHSSLRAASAVAEAPSTDVGAGLPVIIETSNVPVGAAFNPGQPSKARCGFTLYGGRISMLWHLAGLSLRQAE